MGEISMRVTFGQRLRRLREEKEVSQKEIGQLLNVTARMVSFYEHDMSYPNDAESIILLAQYFDVSIDYLFGISNIENYQKLSAINTDYSQLSKKNQEKITEYIELLLEKQRREQNKEARE